ncbi:pyridoxal phosphate-dependent transferase [Gongronella butleri]|nr:pyridoxal phosphate-dependent transferase [Gongronella butleri]
MLLSLLSRQRGSLRGYARSFATLQPAVHDITSDTATRPTDAMFDVMKSATKEDDVFGMDTSTNELEAHVAKLLGHEAALFCASGSMTNQIGLRVNLHQPPHSVLVDVRSHINLYECGGLAYHSQASLTAVQPKGAHLDVADIEANAIKDDLCGALTKIVAVENTLNGTIMPLEQLERVSAYARQQGYKVHMDGARIWEASVATGIPLAEYGRLCDTVSVCVSKGIGAPIGSLVVGGHEQMRKARHLRKLMGGGWRQTGGLAAVAHHCIDNVIPTMKATQQRTQRLWQGLEALGMRTLLPVDTNMIFIDTCGIISLKFWADSLLTHGNIKMDASDDRASRIVLHHQITDQVVDCMLDLTRQLVRDHGKAPDHRNDDLDISKVYPSASASSNSSST